MKYLLSIGLLCFAATCFGQVKSTVETRYSLSGIDGYQIVADQILVPQSSKPNLVPIGLLSVDSKAAMIRVTATTKDRVPVQVKKVSPNTFFVYGSGSIYADVLCVDFDLKIFEQEQFVITIGDVVPIPPDPTPQPNPVVPLDAFDNIGQRVAGWAVGLPRTKEVAAIYRMQSKRLSSDPTTTINTVSDAIVASRTALLGSDAAKYNSLIERINIDMKQRWPLARQVFADYLGAIATGMEAAR